MATDIHQDHTDHLITLEHSIEELERELEVARTPEEKETIQKQISDLHIAIEHTK